MGEDVLAVLGKQRAGQIEKKPSQPDTTCYNINYYDGRLQHNSEYLMFDICYCKLWCYHRPTLARIRINFIFASPHASLLTETRCTPHSPPPLLTAPPKSTTAVLRITAGAVHSCRGGGGGGGGNASMHLLESKSEQVHKLLSSFF